MKKKENMTRRDFISKGAAAAAAPLVLTFVNKSFAKVSNEALNVGVIGVGRRGQNAHLKTLLKFPDVKIAAICDIRKERIEEALKITGNQMPKTYRNYEDLLEQKGLDCVFVSTPPDRHKVMVCEALNAGYSVYVDKPMTLTVTDLEAIGKAVEKAKGAFIVGQQLRYSPSFRRKLQLIHRGEIGDVIMINIKRFFGGSASVVPDGMGGFEPVKKWILGIEQSGDSVLEYAVHWFDLSNWIMGTHPIKAVGLGGQSLHFDERFDREIMDNYKVFLEYPGKRKLFYAQTSISVPGLDPMEDIVYGTKGVFDLNANKLCKRVPAGGPRPEAIVTEDPKDDLDESLWDYLCCQDFFEAHRTGIKPFTDFKVGKTTILTALLARTAIYKKGVVTWDELLREGASFKRLDQ